ncbi:MAG: DUF5333 domain-containing protein [Rhodobacteraceae bacterium]|nr:DUF5333 domain-containing protein [Paracoccaceae bacterium]
MIRAACITAAALVAALPAAASDRVAPDYFVIAVMETTTAQQLALACPRISINPVTISAASGIVLERLTADGFDPALDDLGMADPSAAIAVHQDAFMDKHALRGADQGAVCASALAEMAEGTTIGSYLMEVAQ